MCGKTNVDKSEKEAYKTTKEEKQGIFIFGCVVVVFVGMKILGAG